MLKEERSAEYIADRVLSKVESYRAEVTMPSGIRYVDVHPKVLDLIEQLAIAIKQVSRERYGSGSGLKGR